MKPGAEMDRGEKIESAERFLEDAEILQERFRYDLQSYDDYIKEIEAGDASEGDEEFAYSQAVIAAQHISNINEHLGLNLTSDLIQPKLARVGEYTIESGPFQTPINVAANADFFAGHRENYRRLKEQYDALVASLSAKREQLAELQGSL